MAAASAATSLGGTRHPTSSLIRSRIAPRSKAATGVPQANGELAIEPLIDVKIVGQSVLYMANLPLEANVLFHTIMATKMPFVGRG